MFYAKAVIGDGLELKVNITNEPIYAICPICAAEYEVEKMSAWGMTYGFFTNPICPRCTEARGDMMYDKNKNLAPAFTSTIPKQPKLAPDINGTTKAWYTSYEIAAILGVTDAETGLPCAEAIEAIINKLDIECVEGIDYIKAKDE